MVLLEYRNVSKSFGKAQVLRDINLKIPSGKIIGLLGKNGTGKSTLIKLANDLLTPSSGEVLFMNQPINVASKLQIAYLPERTYLDKAMNVQQTLNFFAEFYDNFNIQKATKLVGDLDLKLNTQIAKNEQRHARKVTTHPSHEPQGQIIFAR